jgi:hypothetical protein
MVPQSYYPNSLYLYQKKKRGDRLLVTMVTLLSFSLEDQQNLTRKEIQCMVWPGFSMF